MVDWKVPLSDVNLGPEEKDAVMQVLERGWLAMGEETQAFESEFSAMTGAKHAIAVANGTASLHLACAALGLGAGDEVIVPSLTFVATANAILYTGATPVFADIASPDDLNISVEAIEALINDRTRAIMVMHYGGYPCDMPAIRRLAEKHHLALIEDAAHAPGASIDGKAMGTWGDVGSFSFFPNKNLTTGEGGMLTTNDDQLAAKIRTLRSHGMTTLTWDRHRGHAWSYDVVDLGYNYRIDDLRSALGRKQLEKLAGHNARRSELTARYRQRLEECVPQVLMPFKEHNGQPSYHILPVLLPEGTERALFANAMKERQVQTSLHYPPIHLFTYYRENGLSPRRPLLITEQAAAREVTLPLYPTMSDGDVDFVVDALQSALQDVREHSPAK